jgi:hypothetical protein
VESSGYAKDLVEVTGSRARLRIELADAALAAADQATGETKAVDVVSAAEIESRATVTRVTPSLVGAAPTHLVFDSINWACGGALLTKSASSTASIRHRGI